MTTLTPTEIRAEIRNLESKYQVSGTRARAILGECIAIYRDILAVLEPTNVVHVDFRGSK